MSDYWYENRQKLRVGDVCELEDGRTVQLERRVPGDGTDWYVSNYEQSYVDGSYYWAYNDSKIHPSEIKDVLNLIRTARNL